MGHLVDVDLRATETKAPASRNVARASVILYSKITSPSHRHVLVSTSGPSVPPQPTEIRPHRRSVSSGGPSRIVPRAAASPRVRGLATRYRRRPSCCRPDVITDAARYSRESNSKVIYSSSRGPIMSAVARALKCRRLAHRGAQRRTPTATLQRVRNLAAIGMIPLQNKATPSRKSRPPHRYQQTTDLGVRRHAQRNCNRQRRRGDPARWRNAHVVAVDDRTVSADCIRGI